MKLLINVAYGGFGFSESFIEYLRKSNVSNDEDNRTSVQIIEKAQEFGLLNAADQSCKLKIVEIPDGCKYEINEYDGWESVHTWIEVSESELQSGMSSARINLAKQVDCIRMTSANFQYAVGLANIYADLSNCYEVEWFENKEHRDARAQVIKERLAFEASIEGIECPDQGVVVWEKPVQYKTWF